MKLLICLLIILSSATIALGQSPEPHRGPKKRAIVTALDVKVQGVATTAPTPSGETTVVTLDIEQPTEFGTGLADMLVTELIASGRFIILERTHLEDIQKELELTGRTGAEGEGPRLLPAQIIDAGR